MLSVIFSLTTRLIAVTLTTASILCAGIASGPMLGHVDMREANVWIQADSASVLRVNYIEIGTNNSIWSQAVETKAELAHTATITLDQVEPGKSYRYQVEVNGELSGSSAIFSTPVFYHNRMPPPDVRIAIVGAHYVPEEGYEPPYQILGSGFRIFNSILDAKPELMIWAGNTMHLRESDWASQSGYLKRAGHARALPELQPLLASIPQYATWGQYDYAHGSKGRYYTYRNYAETSFKAFWPQPATANVLNGIATRFRRSDVEFFMLDVRSYRDDLPSAVKRPAILGKEQIEWLRQELRQSTATFKVIVAGAPILNPAESPENMSRASSEHTELLEMLRSERIEGLLFVSGGKYHGELTRLVHASSYNLYDLTLGPLTANPKGSDELNYFRMPNTHTQERHFALIEFTGPEDDRQFTLRVANMEGEELWTRSVKASQLQPTL